MNCLNRVEMQEYIDDEISPALKDEVVNHLALCKKCRELYGQASSDKELVNGLLSLTATPSGQGIPSFRKPGSKARRVLMFAARLAVAASVLAFIFLTFSDKNNAYEIPEAEILMREFYDGRDLNRMWHEKSQLLILQDEKGNIIISN